MNILALHMVTVYYIFLSPSCLSLPYALAYQVSKKKYIAFLVALVLTNTDTLAQAHIGACGHLGQAAGRDYLALVFFLLAFSFLLQGRFFLYWVAFLIGFLAHLSQGLFAFILLLPISYLATKKVRFVAFNCLSFGLIMLGLYIYQTQGPASLVR